MAYSFEKARKVLKCSQNKELEDITTKYTTLHKNLMQKYTKKITRKSIPKILKNMIWDTNIGEEKGIGKCYCCGQKINSKHFEAGHITAVKNGGTNTLDNLKPICSCCNKSMGTMNMELFKETYMSHITDATVVAKIKTTTVNTGINDTFILTNNIDSPVNITVKNKPVMGRNTDYIWQQKNGRGIATHRATNTRISQCDSLAKAKAAWHTYDKRNSLDIKNKHTPYESFDLLQQYPKDVYLQKVRLTVVENKKKPHSRNVKPSYFEIKKAKRRSKVREYL